MLRLFTWLFFALVFLLPASLRAETPSLTFADGDATGCGNIFVAKVSTDNTTGIWVDGYPPRAGFGTVTDKGETHDIVLGPTAWFTVGMDVQSAGGDQTLTYCPSSSPSNSYSSFGSSGGTTPPPPPWLATSGKATIRLYTEGGSDQYADVTLTNVLFTSPDGKSSVTLPTLQLTHAHVGWYTPG